MLKSGVSKESWQAPKLAALQIEKTLTGTLVTDDELTRDGNDVFIGGPKPNPLNS